MFGVTAIISLLICIYCSSMLLKETRVYTCSDYTCTLLDDHYYACHFIDICRYIVWLKLASLNVFHILRLNSRCKLHFSSYKYHIILNLSVTNQTRQIGTYHIKATIGYRQVTYNHIQL